MIGDLSISRFKANPNMEMTGHVVTRLYRPPEILLGTKIYDETIDIWGMGCTFAELFLPSQQHLFVSNSELD